VLVGAAVMAVAVFLPIAVAPNEPAVVFRPSEDGTLIRHGGWTLIALAIGIAAAGLLASRRRGNPDTAIVNRGTIWLTLLFVLCVVAGLQMWHLAMDKNLRTFYPVYPVGLNGTVDYSKPVVAPLGIAFYAAGVGAAEALVGAVMIRQAKQNPAPQAAGDPAAVQAPTKKCPDCAKTILADTKVCTHCAYRFTDSARNGPPETNSMPG
jgi:hypothetical protein